MEVLSFYVYIYLLNLFIKLTNHDFNFKTLTISLSFLEEEHDLYRGNQSGKVGASL